MSRVFVIAALAAVLGGSGPARAADKYEIDPEHTSVSFKISHLGISLVHGRFNEVAGTAVVDADDPAKSSFTLTIPVRSIDTKVKKRDDHLRSADFFDVEKHPDLVFKSTRVKRTEKGLEVTGEVTLHGVTKPLTFELTGGKTGEFPPGTHRVGYTTAFVLKRSEFGMKTMLGPVGDEVHVEIGLEAIKK
jgi:polyisoprenoid-binding protein YceI